MKIVHKEIIGKYKYYCSTCGKGFNWNENSIMYGKMEYETIQEREENEKYFCSDECAEVHKITVKA